MLKVFLKAFFVTLAIALAAFPVSALAVNANGYLGWGTYIIGGSIQYGADPVDACKKQHDYFSPNSPFIGADFKSGDLNAQCLWNTVIGESYPSKVFFFCAPNYVAVPPGECRLDSHKDDPIIPCDCGGVATNTPNPAIANPVEVLTGQKIEQVTDFATADGRLYLSRYYYGRRGDSSFLKRYVMRFGGRGWAFNFGPILNIRNYSGYNDIASISVISPDGTSVPYTQQFSPKTSFLPSSYQPTIWKAPWGVELLSTPPSNWATSGPSSWKVTDAMSGTVYYLNTKRQAGETNDIWAYATKIVWRGGYEWNLVYGTDGQLSSITDSFGRSMTFTYVVGDSGTGVDHQILVDKVTLPDGSALDYDYTPYFSGKVTDYDFLSTVRRLQSATGPGASVVLASTTYHYEDTRYRGALTGITDPRGVRFATWTYDADGHVASSSHAGAETYLFSYSPGSSSPPTDPSTTVTNPLGKSTTYTWSYSSSGSYRLLTQISAAASTNSPSSSQSINYGTSVDGLVSSTTDEKGRVTNYQRQGNGMPTTVTQAYGLPEARSVNYAWRSDQQLSSKTEPGLNTTYTYYANGLLNTVTETDTTSQTVPYSTNDQSRTWTYTYTAQGLLASVDGPLAGAGDKQSFTYDVNGYLSTVTDEVGNVTTITSKDSAGRPLLITDPNGVVTQLTYSPLGYLTSIAEDHAGLDVVTTIQYDAIGNVTSITREDGSSYTYTYDNARRLTAITDANGSKLEYTLDAAGDATLITVKNAGATLRYSLSQTFDELGRLLTSVGVNAATRTFGYDKVSNLVSQTDPRGGVVQQAFDGLNRLVQSVDQGNHATNIAPAPQGGQASVTDARTIATSYVRNGWGEIIQESSPDVGTIIYERNAAGWITKKTDARGIVANYTYDNAGRQLTISYPAATAENVTFGYDAATPGANGKGRLTSFTDPTSTTTLAYNGLGKVTSETVVILGYTVVTSYSYDAAGNLQTITYPSGRTVSYWRDPQGEINSVSTKLNASAPLEEIVNNVDWLPFSSKIMAMTEHNGLSLVRSYDLNYRANQISLLNGATTVLQRTYGYSDKLNITGIQDNLSAANSETYSYAANNMLANAVGSWGTETYTQDAAGNINQKTTVVGGVTTTDQLVYAANSNRLGSITRAGTTQRSFTYDADGNTLTDVQAGVTTTYGYSNANRLASVTRGATPIATYKYNARHQLVIRTVTNSVPSGTTVSFYDQAGHVIAEYDGVTAALKREYIWLGDTPIAVIDPGTPTKTYYVTTDHLDRPIAMTDSTKAFVASATWKPFGLNSTYSGTQDISLRFPGQMFQAETGLHYNWFRQYDPTIGRYTQPDPVGLDGGIQRYAYVGNDPVQKFDARGTTPITSTPWDMMKVGKNRWRFFDENGDAWYDIELPGDHCDGPAYHIWTNGVRGIEIPFPGSTRR